MKKKYVWAIGFWLGVVIISLINIISILLNKNPLAYDSYILGVSVIVMIIYIIVLIKRKKKNIK